MREKGVIRSISAFLEGRKIEEGRKRDKEEAKKGGKEVF